jgi:hypothetical protein
MCSNPQVDEILVYEILAELGDAHLRLLRVCQEFPKDGHGPFCGEWIRPLRTRERSLPPRLAPKTCQPGAAGAQ